MDLNTYLNLHGWYTRGLELGQISPDSYVATVQRLANALAGEAPEPTPPVSPHPTDALLGDQVDQ